MAKKELSGHEYERANICAECEGPLAAENGHYHSRRAYPYGHEPVCCNCVADSICQDKPLALSPQSVVGYSHERNTRPGKGGNRGNQDEEINSSREEQEDMSKTSQKNAKVSKAMKGQKEAKASKNGHKPRKEKIPYAYTPIPASYSGNVHKVATNGKVVSPVHAVANGSTLCGYGTLEQSKGDKHYELQFVKTTEDVACKRCLAPKVEKSTKAEKKPTPITKAKKAKAAAE